ncbi:MAG: beta-galactosidase, partial [Clostridia bacterium]|nr:beta-galactosidase [Clostridia bacterium]
MGILTYRGSSFYMDGEPYTILSGAMHYFRIPRAYWHDRLLKLKECGLNTVETYIPWNLHEPKEGEYDFSGNLDLSAYISEAEALGLNVILRPGPYICAEWEFGGLPAWLLSYEKMPLRCNDGLYLEKLGRYFKALLAQARPHLASAGGAVCMIQIENEYGSFGNDKDYLRAIAKIYADNGIDCLYFTSDGPCDTMLSGGTLEEYLAVANFGSKPEANLANLKHFRPDQPLMCGEYWCGWFDHWSEKHHTRTAEEICSDFEGFFRLGASFNFYMFHGGTNFGFMNGANYYDRYLPTITSYDYCAPLNEAGDRTPTYYAVRDMIAKYCGEVPPLTASDTPKAAYGKVCLTEKADLFENLDRLAKPVFSPAPKFMEEYGQSYGYILYRSTLEGPREERRITVESIHDRVQIFLDGEKRGTYTRWAPPAEGDKVSFALAKGEKMQIDLLVENMGRVNYGPKLRDRKGISGVRMEGQYHFGWEAYCLPMEEELEKLVFQPADDAKIAAPTFLRGCLEIAGEPAD